ncbi:MAG: hypothetical protein FJX75_28130, partial [Armatimonadetes bacterium]|nr:hypothetical protein [Armatimonadota bacterium]
MDLTPRFGGEALNFCRLDGFFAADPEQPTGPLFCVGNGPQTSDRVACLVSYDNGATWHDYAVSTSTLGPLYSITGCRQVTRDGYVIGAFTEQPTGGSADRGAKVYFLRACMRSTASGVVNHAPTVGHDESCPYMTAMYGRLWRR